MSVYASAPSHHQLQGPILSMFNSLNGHTEISGGIFTLNYNDIKAGGIESALLAHHFVPSATHDTNDVPNPPQCHPGTRVALLKGLLDWVKDTESSTRILWLFGPAGAGKSAIAHTVAEGLSAAGNLAASFFFSRMDARRNMAKPLVATIVYQITRHNYFPKLQAYISAAIFNDPMIFHMSLRTQFERLIVDPVKEVHASHPPSKLSPALIIIDGLDECDDREGRKLILETIFDAVPRLVTSFKFLICSRPEDDIRRLFEGSNISDEIRFAELLPDCEAYEDIRLYLRDGLAQLKRTHPIAETLGSEWPPNEAIEALVDKSSGHFIYPSSVLKYIDSRCYRPQECLDTILSLRALTPHNPYAELDAIYHDILASSQVDRKRLSDVLALSLVCIRANELFASLDLFIESLLALERGSVKLLFLDLCSVVSLRKSPWSMVLRPVWSIKFEHKSFVDFLLDASRSREFCVDLRHACMTAAKACLKALNDRSYLTRFWRKTVNMNTAQKCTFDNSIKMAYQRVLTWCCRHALPDTELQNKLLDHNVLKSLPPRAVRYGKSFDVFLDFLDAIKEGPAFQNTNVFKNHLALLDEYLKDELDYWVTVQPRLMILLSMFISRNGIKWTRLIESRPRESLKSIMQPSLDYACEISGVCLPHFFMWFMDGRMASFALSSDILSKFVCDFFYSEERAGKYFLGRKAYRWLTI